MIEGDNKIPLKKPDASPIYSSDGIKHYNDEYVLLWRNVIIRALRDSCDCQQLAFLNYNWAKSDDCKEVCQMAYLSYAMVSKKLISIYKSPEAREETFGLIKDLKHKSQAGKKMPKFVNGKREYRAV